MILVLHFVASGSGSGSNVSKKNNSVCSTENVIVDVSSAAENLQNLSLGKGELDDNFSVVLPDHLQALAADCSHLSFGTYKSRVSSALTRSLPSNQFEDDFEGASTAMDGLTRGHLNTRHRCFFLVSICTTSCIMSHAVLIFLTCSGIWDTMVMGPLHPCMKVIERQQMLEILIYLRLCSQS